MSSDKARISPPGRAPVFSGTSTSSEVTVGPDTWTKVEEDLKVSELEIDPEIQRFMLNEQKVQRILTNFDPKAVRRILVSRRKDRSLRVLDGWHRLEVVRRLTDNAGTIPAEVYTGLSRQEEANLFLLANAGDKPNTIERYRVSLIAGDQEVSEIDKMVHAYGWKVGSFTDSNGTLACVVALLNLYRFSVRHEQQPNLVQMALMIVTRAWGNEHSGAQGHLITAVGRIVGEYGDQLDVDKLIHVLRNWRNGPTGLSIQAKTYASTKRLRLPMATAEIIVDHYNAERGGKKLRSWIRRA